MKKIYLLSFFFLFFMPAETTFAQVGQVFYQTFELQEGVDTLRFLSFKSPQFQEWSSDKLMIETTVSLHDCTHTRKMVLPAEPYNLIIEKTSGKNWAIKYAQEKHLVIKTMQNEVCREVVSVKIYVPTDFSNHSATELIKKSLLTASSK